MHYDDLLGEDRPIDVHVFVALTQGLHVAFSQVSEAKLTEGRRSRWQRRLVAISEAARVDLPAASEQLARFERDWGRAVLEG
jgi:hypothetical protein